MRSKKNAISMLATRSSEISYISLKETGSYKLASRSVDTLGTALYEIALLLIGGRSAIRLARFPVCVLCSYESMQENCSAPPSGRTN
jgi:CRISPR/Cas system-associated exonuclease Cas4 (RecB family)